MICILTIMSKTIGQMMEIFIKALSQKIDDLLLDITKFEVKMKKEMEEQEKKEK